MLEIRQIKEDDEEGYLGLMYELDNQTRFMLYEPGERKSTLEDTKEKSLPKVPNLAWICKECLDIIMKNKIPENAAF